MSFLKYDLTSGGAFSNNDVNTFSNKDANDNQVIMRLDFKKLNIT